MGFPEIDGKRAGANEKIQAVNNVYDLHELFKVLHMWTSTLHKCRDSRWYQLHGSFNSKIVMKLLGVPERPNDVTPAEAVKEYAEATAKWTSTELDAAVNDQNREAGCIAFDSPEAFLATPHVCHIPTDSSLTVSR